jgi:hypothetical protein
MNAAPSANSDQMKIYDADGCRLTRAAAKTGGPSDQAQETGSPLHHDPSEILPSITYERTDSAKDRTFEVREPVAQNM